MCFGPDEDQHQIEQNFRNLLFIYMVMTSNQKINKICILNFFDKHYFRPFSKVRLFIVYLLDIFKAQVNLRFTSAFNKLKFLSIFLSFYLGHSKSGSK